MAKGSSMEETTRIEGMVAKQHKSDYPLRVVSMLGLELGLRLGLRARV